MSCINRDTRLAYNNTVRPIPLTTWDERSRKRYDEPFTVRLKPTAASNLITRLHFTMQSDAFTHAFQSTTFTLSEFEEGSDRLDTYLQALASRHNSNQAFEADDSFTVETMVIHTPAPGSGHGKRYKPSSAAVRGIVKRSRVTIKNRDELCCAGAIVSMKALVDANGNARDHLYHNLKQSPRAIGQGTPSSSWGTRGPCGVSELQKFKRFSLTTRSKSYLLTLLTC